MDELKHEDGSADDWLEQGQVLFEQGDYEGAIACYERAVAIEPSNVEVWLNYGKALRQVERFEEAIATCDKAIQLKPDSYKAWCGRGIALSALGCHEEAISSYDKALHLKSDEHRVWGARGNELFALERFEEAILSYDKVLQLKPDSDQAWSYLGLTLGKLGRNEEAIASCDKALQLKPDNYNALCHLGLALNNLRRYEEAITNYDKAIQFNLDYYEAWSYRAKTLSDLGRHEEAITSCDKALQYKLDCPITWFCRGIVLSRLSCYEEAITNYDKAIQFRPNYYEAWDDRGNALYALGRYEEAITSYDYVLQYKPDYHQAWNNRGSALERLGRYEEAITSYDYVLQYKPDYHQAWHDRGIVLGKLGRYEEAITSYDNALQYKPDYHQAWHDRGIVLDKLGCYEEAITSYDNALQYKPDFHQAWNNRGRALEGLGRYEEAISNYDNALQLTQEQYWYAWANQGNAIQVTQGYRAALAVWDEGLSALLPTTSDYQHACGVLHRRKGQTQYQEGRKQTNPFPDWDSARKSYLKTLEFWTFENPQFTQPHLEVLQELSTVSYLFSPVELKALLEEATAKLQRILQNPELTLGQKITLETKFAGFNQLQVTNLAQQNPTQALELAEARKNRCLGRLRDGWSYKPPAPTYAQIQTLLTPGTAILYWHLSPAALTTFILKPNQPPQVFQPTPPPSNPDRPLTQQYPAAAHQLQRFETWMQQWKQDYRSYSDLPPAEQATAPWRDRMAHRLFYELREILETQRLCQDHLQDIDHLILIPHRDLHLLPIHAIFPGRFTITYLPSAQLSLDLQNHPGPPLKRLLSIQNPATQSIKPKTDSPNLLYAELESHLIQQQYGSRAMIIPGTEAQQTRITAALKWNFQGLHFTGHSYHNTEAPLQSALALAGQDLLTLKDIFQLKLQPYTLICLSACETGITSTQDIIDEYVGLVSGFLAAGAAHVISTLWTVEEISSALLMIQFYELLRKPLPPAKALSEAQQWLKLITYQELSTWYQTQAVQLAKIDPGNNTIIKILQTLAKLAQKKADEPGVNDPPYAHPFYWAGFTITGKVPSGL
jgi:tetratricopeptide (TPR) repeat protein